MFDRKLFSRELKSDRDVLNRLAYVQKSPWICTTFILLEDCCKQGKIPLLRRLHCNIFVDDKKYIQERFRDSDVYNLKCKYKLRLFYFALVKNNWAVYNVLYELGYYRMESIPNILKMSIH